MFAKLLREIKWNWPYMLGGFIVGWFIYEWINSG